MQKLIQLTHNLTSEELARFNELCRLDGVHPSKKVASIIRDFILSRGVKHLAAPAGTHENLVKAS